MTTERKKTHPWRAHNPLNDPDAVRRQEQICPRSARLVTTGGARPKARRP